MKQRNIHGVWDMSFENHCLHCRFTGATNESAANAWFDDMKHHVLSSPDKGKLPWVILSDMREWGISSLDAWDKNNENAEWMMKHGCIYISMVFSKKLQKFSVEQGFNNLQPFQFFSDYDEAKQSCIDKLASIHSVPPSS
ncbi:hypothetical protein L4C34_00030 [Vibrio profundum]|uniref:hypothetical protein n=1 Tax=Vibrio profundum TaxID=2910247 RepID=UPI003D0F2FEC